MSSEPHVGVVVPTVLRPELPRAIASVKAQGIETRCIVVVDKSPEESDGQADNWLKQADHVVWTGGGAGAARARSLGVELAAGIPWIAYLDDDDWWLPDKLRIQLELARRLAKKGFVPVVSCRVYHVWAGSTGLSEPLPKNLLDTETARVEDYLFSGRGPSVDRPSVFLPTLLLPGNLARQVPWDASLRRHQDWDWLIRASRQPRVRIVHSPEALAVITIGSAGSISASPDWETSLRWARRWRGAWSDRTMADFIWGQCMRYALSGRDWRGVAACYRAARALSQRPSRAAVLLSMTGVIPRHHLERFAHGAARLTQSKRTRRQS